MPELNPDPYDKGDKLGPTGCVTAIFDSLSDLTKAIPPINVAGFTGADCAIFVGGEGKKKLDATGEYHAIEGLRMFQNAVCDEAELFEQFDHALEAGGAVVAIRTGDDETKKKSVTEILKVHHAHKIDYWGEWHFDGLG